MTNRFSLVVNLGENAKVTVGFDLIDDDGEPYVDFEDLKVWYKGVDIIDTLDVNDLAYLDKQIMQSWDLIEDQIRSEWNDYY
jgi:hypothetical protein